LGERADFVLGERANSARIGDSGAGSRASWADISGSGDDSEHEVPDASYGASSCTVSESSASGPWLSKRAALAAASTAVSSKPRRMRLSKTARRAKADALRYGVCSDACVHFCEVHFVRDGTLEEVEHCDAGLVFPRSSGGGLSYGEVKRVLLARRATKLQEAMNMPRDTG
jgi:hypothetical protein